MHLFWKPIREVVGIYCIRKVDLWSPKWKVIGLLEVNHEAIYGEVKSSSRKQLGLFANKSKNTPFSP